MEERCTIGKDVKLRESEELRDILWEQWTSGMMQKKQKRETE